MRIWCRPAVLYTYVCSVLYAYYTSVSRGPDDSSSRRESLARATHCPRRRRSYIYLDRLRAISGLILLFSKRLVRYEKTLSKVSGKFRPNVFVPVFPPPISSDVHRVYGAVYSVFIRVSMVIILRETRNVTAGHPVLTTRRQRVTRRAPVTDRRARASDAQRGPLD